MPSSPEGSAAEVHQSNTGANGGEPAGNRVAITPDSQVDGSKSAPQTAPNLAPKERTQLREGLRASLDAVHWQVRRREIGTVVRANDGIAYVQGLPSVQYGELVQEPRGITGLAFDLWPDEVGVLFLDPSDHIAAGAELHATGRVASIPVGEELLGRVVDALGRPLDGGAPLRSTTLWPVEREAPGVVDRQPVRESLLTGTKVIDALLPLGRGQRELLLGDRATGKTSIALTAMLAQDKTGVICIYAAIGQRRATVVDVMETLRTHQALERSIVVVGDADSPPGHQYLTPYAACTIGEYFMSKGKHVLVVYDDLSKHADAYRRICLLFGRPPGREAYPSDVFYLHARLLERATRLHDRLGGGSLTALPIAETQAGNIAAYIPTNLISITDGQIYLNTRLFNEGVRPAVDTGLSVSRVGGDAQPKALREITGDLRITYAQMRELEQFARFGAALEAGAQARLERGRRLREAFTQPRLIAVPLSMQIATIIAVREGVLDTLPVTQVAAYLAELEQMLAQSASDLMAQLDQSGTMDDAAHQRLRGTVTAARTRLEQGSGT
jgi:F-type H+-transporting ATPase subunit alpha